MGELEMPEGGQIPLPPPHQQPQSGQMSLVREGRTYLAV